MGYVYFLTHKRMPGLVKIGRSASVNDRLASLNGATGVPGPFDLRHTIECLDEARLESDLHKFLSAFRLTNQREFFEIPLKYAIRAAEICQDRAEIDDRSVPSAECIACNSTEEIGKLILHRRKDIGWTQLELAKKAQTGLRVVAEVERGKETAQIKIVLRILAALDLGFSVRNTGANFKHYPARER